MTARSFDRLLREWVALLAILAMALGPLALATSRSLAAQERVQVAAGLAPLPVCAPGDSMDGLAGKTGGNACDHCLPALESPQKAIDGPASAAIFTGLMQPADAGPSALLSRLRLPPATGPPAA
jgi:hypothetical protein